MKPKKKLLLFFLRRFGILNGLTLYLKFKTGSVKNIKVKNIKHPLSLRPLTSDIPTFYQVFLDNEYNIKFEKKPKLIIDCGANIGLFAIKMKNKFPETQIIAIEPDPDNFQMLQNNLLKYKDVFLENNGIWNKDTINSIKHFIC